MARSSDRTVVFGQVHCVILCAAAAFLVASSSVGQAQDLPLDARAAAELLDVEATALFKEGKTRAALATFKKVYGAYPNPTTAWNIGRCYEELRQLQAARAAFQLYLGLEGLDSASRESAEDKIRAIDSRIGRWAELDALALMRLGTEDHDGALEAAKEAHGLNAVPDTHWTLILAYQGSGDLTRARSEVVDYLEVPGLDIKERAAARAKLAEIDEEREKSAQKITATTPAPSHSPATRPTPEGHEVLGWISAGLAVSSLGAGTYLFFIHRDTQARRETAGDAADIASFDRLDRQARSQERWRNGSLIAGGVLAAGSALLFYLMPNDTIDSQADVRIQLGPAAATIEIRF